MNTIFGSMFFSHLVNLVNPVQSFSPLSHVARMEASYAGIRDNTPDSTTFHPGYVFPYSSHITALISQI